MRRGTRDSKMKTLKKLENWYVGNNNTREREVVGNMWWLSMSVNLYLRGERIRM